MTDVLPRLRHKFTLLTEEADSLEQILFNPLTGLATAVYNGLERSFFVT